MQRNKVHKYKTTYILCFLLTDLEVNYIKDYKIVGVITYKDATYIMPQGEERD